MDKELVEKITRLVLERMSLVENPTKGKLGDDEIKEWNSFHDAGVVNHTHKENIQYLVPLSDSEVSDWSNITLNNAHTYSNKVKFTRY
ncbi:hypothetical protein M670_01599 [Schinkia azotoformans MEV2011]|uniref:Uncharacterized protein n=1 Tax=Schinkia azotoformans MEV2011 TaxID=1348973 RepID=A0A072NQP6_SCHAZ|nr:hypothetical protein [Schinkia azotoformans]KEF39208.1 hypothetical protein M670_01599 [Schinkia azotoformans MEV2011]MEC1695875.1 hypothetical protein [Schinkia azotoformans]MEC1726031.1 hypothetical protein [Schinkia azotoformans]MEC1772052.1 hypothetical protein [Schinkia azotoformans]MEC1781437.1 hypothetical protein [Schinkia azotoformans]